jgi:hypothetical protein
VGEGGGVGFATGEGFGDFFAAGVGLETGEVFGGAVGPWATATTVNPTTIKSERNHKRPVFITDLRENVRQAGGEVLRGRWVSGGRITLS